MRNSEQVCSIVHLCVITIHIESFAGARRVFVCLYAFKSRFKVCFCFNVLIVVIICVFVLFFYSKKVSKSKANLISTTTTKYLFQRHIKGAAKVV